MVNFRNNIWKSWLIRTNLWRNSLIRFNLWRTCLYQKQKKQADPQQIVVAGTKIKWLRVAKHLRNYIRSDMRDSDDIQHKSGDFISRINNLSVNFGKCRHMVKQIIFNLQCSHLYGCESWNHMDLWVDKFRKTWNNGVRRVFFSTIHDTHQISKPVNWEAICNRSNAKKVLQNDFIYVT